MIGAGPGLLRLDAGTAMRDNSLKAAGGGSSGALAKQKAAAGGAYVVDAAGVALGGRCSTGRAPGQGSNR